MIPEGDPQDPRRPRPGEGANPSPECPPTDPVAEALAELTEMSSGPGDPPTEAIAPGSARVSPGAVGEAGSLRDEVQRLRAELAMALKEKEAVMGDAEQLASDVRELSSKLSLAQAVLERERATLHVELQQERGRREKVEKDLEASRQQLEGSLRELGLHRGGKEEAEKVRAGWEKANSELRAREKEIAELRDEREKDAEEMARTQAEMAKHGAEVARLAQDLSESRARTTRLQGELEASRKEAATLEARLSASPRPAPPAATGAPRLLPTVPVAFYAADGKTIAKQALFAVGKGEALEAFLTVLLGQWKASKLPLVPSGGPEGLSVQLKGDPHRRSLRILPSGTIQIQLSPPELKEVSDLPTLVSRKAPVGPPATTQAPRPG